MTLWFYDCPGSVSTSDRTLLCYVFMAKQLGILAPQFCKPEIGEVLAGMPVFCPLDRIPERNGLKVMEDLL